MAAFLFLFFPNQSMLPSLNHFHLCLLSPPNLFCHSIVFSVSGFHFPSLPFIFNNFYMVKTSSVMQCMCQQQTTGQHQPQSYPELLPLKSFSIHLSYFPAPSDPVLVLHWILKAWTPSALQSWRHTGFPTDLLSLSYCLCICYSHIKLPGLSVTCSPPPYYASEHHYKSSNMILVYLMVDWIT